MQGDAATPPIIVLMDPFDALGMTPRYQPPRERTPARHVVLQRRLQRVLAFRRHSIDDVVNNPLVKNDVLGYWKVLKQIDRYDQVHELEQQWNHLGRRL